jgi:hypothetical protein
MLPLLLVALCAAEPPDGALPLVDRHGLMISWSEQARAAGAEGEAAVLAARGFAEDLSLFFTVPDGDGRRLVTLHDLGAWEVELSVLEAAALANVAAGINAQRPQVVQVEGDPRSYLLSAEGDGLDQAALFAPEALSARFAGGAVAVGLPARGVLIAFPLGDRELETMVSVGIRRLWESVEEPVSPKAYRWDGEGWVVWGEAKPSAQGKPAGEGDPLARPLD